MSDRVCIVKHRVYLQGSSIERHRVHTYTAEADCSAQSPVVSVE